MKGFLDSLQNLMIPSNFLLPCSLSPASLMKSHFRLLFLASCSLILPFALLSVVAVVVAVAAVAVFAAAQ